MMNRMDKSGAFVAVTLAACFMSNIAQAADVNTGLGIGDVQPSLDQGQAGSIWNGAYAGLQAGVDWRTMDPDNTGQSKTEIGKNIGGYVGINQQLGDYLVGGLEWQGGYIGKNITEGAFTAKQNWETSLRARMGYAVEQNLIYGLAGVAASQVEVTGATGSDTNWLTGYTVGAGVERKLTDRITGRLEYDYSDFGSKTFNLGPASTQTGLSSHNVKIGVGFNF